MYLFGFNFSERIFILVHPYLSPPAGREVKIPDTRVSLWQKGSTKGLFMGFGKLFSEA